MITLKNTKSWMALAVSAAMLVFSSAATAQIAFTGEDTEPEVKEEAVVSRQNTQSPYNNSSAQDTDSKLADAAEKYQHAVGVVIGVVPGHGQIPIGTAWAYEDRLFATNSHVVNGMIDLKSKIPSSAFFIAINGRPDKRLRVAAYMKHPKYGKDETNFEGDKGLPSNDIAKIRTVETAPVHFELADVPQLQRVKSGLRIAYLGFPMEGLLEGNLNTRMPIATMQSGIITSVSDRFLSDGGFSKNRTIRHNLPAAGGASGSPIFGADGKVVAILWGGNISMRITLNNEGKPVHARTPNAALVNFAERIDSLKEVPRP